MKKTKPATKHESKNPHAKYSPSMLEHLEVCAGYEKEEGDNQFSEEGTMLHKACESGRTQGLDTEQTNSVRQCLDYVGRFKRKDTVVDQKEVRLDAEGLTWGTADRLLIHKDETGDLFDFKFGRNSVDDAETNLQGWTYSLGTFHAYKKLKRLTVHFLLPRRDEISTAIFERAALDDIRIRVKTVIARRKKFETSRDPKLLNPRPANCIYCGAKATCQSLHSIAFKIAKKYDETFQIPSEVHSSQIQDPKEMAKAKAIAIVMAKWADSVTEHALQMVLNGTELPGWELTSRQGKLKINDSQAAFTAVKTIEPDLTEEEFLKYVAITKTALENLVADRAAHGEKASRVRSLNEALIDMGIGVRDPDTNYLRRIKS
jgi:hypothetical protein